MRRMLILAAMAPLLAAAPKSCNIADIGDYVVTFDISVTDRATAPVLVSISGPDVQRRSLLQPGATISVMSFSPGTVDVSVQAQDPGIARQLLQKGKELEEALTSKVLDPVAAAAIQQKVDGTLQQYLGAPPDTLGTSCTIDLSPDHGKGIDVSYVADMSADGHWILLGPRCG
jgi:hypothetical protein